MSAEDGVRLESWRLPQLGQTVNHLVIDDGALIRVRLTPADQLALVEYTADEASIADRLRGLELLVRRIEEQSRKRGART